MALAVLAAAAALVGLLWLTGYTVDEQPLWLVLASTLVLQLGLLAVAFGLGPLRHGSPGQLFGHRRLPALRLFGWAALAFFASITISAVYVALAGQVSDELVPDPLPGGIDFGEMRLLSFVSVALLAPFAEEVFFRGFLFAGFAKRYGFWIAAIISALVFGLVHMELGRVMPALLSGLVFAGAYWRSGSLWPAVLAHTGQNAIAFGVVL